MKRIKIIRAIKKLADGRRFVIGKGNVRSKYFVVGGSPGLGEIKEGSPFVGKAGGEILHNSLESAGIKETDCYITNAVKVLSNRVTVRKMEAWRPILKMEAEFIKPEIIIAIGRVARLAVAGIPTYEKEPTTHLSIREYLNNKIESVLAFLKG